MLSDTFEYPLPISLVVGARGLLVGLSIGLSLLPVRGVIAALLLEDLLPVLEVVATAPNRTTGFAAPAEAVPGPLSAIILGQGLALVAIGAGLRLQDLSRKLLFRLLPCRSRSSGGAGIWGQRRLPTRCRHS
jgi:hypothetical protein